MRIQVGEMKVNYISTSYLFPLTAYNRYFAPL